MKITKSIHTKRTGLLTLEAFVLILLSIGSATTSFAQKYVPADGKCLVFVGQDLEATGGLDGYADGYTDHFDTPAGITIYTNLSPGNESYGHYNQGLDGLQTKANWGAGDSWADLYLQDSTYKNTAISIGLSFVHHEKEVAKGKLDHLIVGLTDWIKEANRPIFLRIGYEFDGWSWNYYKKKHYLGAWASIHSVFQEQQVDNVVFVWQSKGSGTSQETLEDWYPGDDMVDWCGYSYFGQPDQEMLTFARKHNKPVFIAEATPVRQTDNLFFDTDMKKQPLDETIWKEWFVPFFRVIEENSDVIKAFSYINSDWPSQPMWVVNPVFSQVDSRLQLSQYITKKWKNKMQNIRYIQASDSFWTLPKTD